MLNTRLVKPKIIPFRIYFSPYTHVLPSILLLASSLFFLRQRPFHFRHHLGLPTRSYPRRTHRQRQLASTSLQLHVQRHSSLPDQCCLFHSTWSSHLMVYPLSTLAKKTEHRKSQ